MAKVTGMSQDIQNYRTVRGRITYSEVPGVRNIVKTYRRPGRVSAGVGNLLSLTVSDRKEEWESLTPGEKDSWNTEGAKIQMTGFELFIQEGWKMGLDAIAGVGRSKFCYSNGAVL